MVKLVCREKMENIQDFKTEPRKRLAKHVQIRQGVVMVKFWNSSTPCPPGHKFNNTDLKWPQEWNWADWISTALMSQNEQLEADVRKLRLGQIDERKTKKRENKETYESSNAQHHELMKKTEIQTVIQLKTLIVNETWISLRPKLQPSNPNLSAAFSAPNHANFRENYLKNTLQMNNYRRHVGARQKHVVKMCEMKWALENILNTLHGYGRPQNNRKFDIKQISLVLA